MVLMRTLGRWVLRCAASLGLLVLAVTFTPLVFWWATALAGPWNDPTGDVLIVLTGSILDERTIGLTSYWRGVYAAHVFLDDHFQEMIVSGGGTDVTPIAIPMKQFIVSQGVPEQAVRLETASNNTRESAEEVTRMIQAEPSRYHNRKLVLLTSDYHMFRSHRLFERAGLNVLPRPFPDARKRYASPLERWGIFLDLTEESAKIVYYWGRGWL